MPSSEMALAELFKSNGYATGHIGKWHLGYTRNSPMDRGLIIHLVIWVDVSITIRIFFTGLDRIAMTYGTGKEIWRDKSEYFEDLMVDECKEY